MLAATKKRYMFIIYELGCTGESVRSVDIAKALDVKKASISNMLPSLINENLVEKNSEGIITFTPQGAKYAGNLYLKYLTLYRFFSKKLGSSEKNARADAIVCLCSLSDESTESIADYILETGGG